MFPNAYLQVVICFLRQNGEHSVDALTTFDEIFLDVLHEVLSEVLGEEAYRAFFTYSGFDTLPLTASRLDGRFVYVFSQKGAEILERIVLVRLSDRLKFPFDNNRAFQTIVEEAREKNILKRALE
jgi:hypothetical protein